jgi:hypothetical protein
MGNIQQFQSSEPLKMTKITPVESPVLRIYIIPPIAAPCCQVFEGVSNWCQRTCKLGRKAIWAHWSFECKRDNMWTIIYNMFKRAEIEPVV